MITANPDIKIIENRDLDFIIMGCDGIWEIKQNHEMVEWVRRRIDNRKPLDAILEELLDELLSKDSGNQYGMDNMSAILVKFDKKWSIQPSINSLTLDISLQTSWLFLQSLLLQLLHHSLQIHERICLIIEAFIIVTQYSTKYYIIAEGLVWDLLVASHNKFSTLFA